MPGPTPVDLGPEIPDCPGRFHGTYSAVNKGGCVCPGAKAAYRERRRVYNRASYRPVEIPRYRDVDPQAVADAIAGLIVARKLTTDERRRVVTELARRGMKDWQIADHLRWSGGGYRGRLAVVKFRSRWRIPAADPRPRRDHYEEAA